MSVKQAQLSANRKIKAKDIPHEVRLLPSLSRNLLILRKNQIVLIHSNRQNRHQSSQADRIINKRNPTVLSRHAPEEHQIRNNYEKLKISQLIYAPQKMK